MDPMEAKPYTYDELRERYPFDDVDELPEEWPAWARPIAPMTVDEANTILHGIIEKAVVAELDEEDCFIHGQMMNVLKSAAQGEALTGKEGRYLVVSEETLKKQRVLEP